jgi:1,4-dihydroxy-2-naphthoyl-CoA hydrolase
MPAASRSGGNKKNRGKLMATESQADVVNPEGDSAFMRLLGVRFEEMGAEKVVASFETGPDHHQPWGLVHGGVFTAVIETVATTGAYHAVKDRGQLAVGVNNTTDFMRPHQEGRLRVVAEPLQQGKLQQLWQAVITREDGKTVARGQVRLQNIEADT